MAIPLYQVDVFAQRLFGGNPAAVCLLEQELPDALLQRIAAENNLSETAFLLREPDDADADYRLRWFTPTVEVELCGHATLASGWVLFERRGWERPELRFRTRQAGLLRVARRDDGLWLDLPARPPRPLPQPAAALAQALGAQPVTVLAYDSIWLAVFASARTVEGLKPDFAALRALPAGAVCVTAAASDADFVSRYFAPKAGIDEDPVTGSAHCLLAPYWSERLGRSRLRAIQLSARRGHLSCEWVGDRVWLQGAVQPYLEGWIALPPSSG